MINKMSKEFQKGYISGSCANCQKVVFESLWLLDDAYNVWLGKCPHCGALNFLSMNHGLRGYSSAGMHLVLPTIEEIEPNNLPKDTPTSGLCGHSADQHGSPLGEFCHKLTENIRKKP